MEHHEIVTRMSLIWHSDENIWELSLSSVSAEIAQRMGQDALDLTAAVQKLAMDEVRTTNATGMISGK